MNIKSENEINNSIDTNMNIKSENEINNSIDTNMNIKSENEINNSIDMNIKSENEINNSIDTNMNIKLENNEEIDIQKNYEVISKLFGEEFVCYKNETEEDIIKYHINNEKKYMVDCEYMKKQSDINESMRKILIDWLVDVRYKFEFKSKTLYLCVNIIDRFLSKKIVARNKLQLVGLVAMMIAAKYQEKHIPEISEFIHISAYAYTKDELLRMERVILNTIDFNLNVTTIPMLLSFYINNMNLCGDISFLSQYICYTAIQELNYTKYTPCTITKSSLLLSIIIYKLSTYPRPQNKYILNFINYTDLYDCIIFLYKSAVSQRNTKLTAIRKTFCSARCNHVARLFAKTSEFIDII